MDEHLMVIEDQYTGSVSQGSAPQRRAITGGTITKMSVGPMDNNSYLIVCSTTGQSLLVDAANEAERLSQLIDENAPVLTLIVTTHSVATLPGPSHSRSPTASPASRTCSPVTPCSPAVSARPLARRSSPACSMTSVPRSSTSTATRQSSTRDTERTRHWATSAPTWRNGGNGVGETPARLKR